MVAKDCPNTICHRPPATNNHSTMTASNENEQEHITSTSPPYKYSSKQAAPLTRIDSNVLDNSPSVIHTTHSVDRLNENALSIDLGMYNELKHDGIPAASLSSNEDVFYEASPILTDAEQRQIDDQVDDGNVRYFPSLLEETNYPTIAVRMEPHMKKPLGKDCELDLALLTNRMIPPRTGPFYNEDLIKEINDPDILCLLRIIDYEIQVDDKPVMPTPWKSKIRSWLKCIVSSPDIISEYPWTRFIRHPQNSVNETPRDEVYIDEIFDHIYNSY